MRSLDRQRARAVPVRRLLLYAVDLDVLISSGFLIPEEGPDIQPSGNGSRPPDPKAEESRERKAAAVRVLEFLNQNTGKHFRPVPSVITMIEARLSEFDETTLRAVVLHRCQLWSSDEKMADYLRPATLFGARNCANYAGEIATQ